MNQSGMSRQPIGGTGNPMGTAMASATGHRAGEEDLNSCTNLISSNSTFLQATMGITLSVFLYEGAAYNFIFLGRILPALGDDALCLPFRVVFNVVWGLALLSYLRAAFADPGVVPKRWHDFTHTVGEGLHVVPSRFDWQPGKATFCRKCQVPRPERSHHCNICKLCVLRMDHHCPWINNCVGYHNHKYFLLLVIYGTAASALGLATSLPTLLLCIGIMLKLDVQGAYLLETTDIVSFLMFCCLATFLAVMLSPMMFTHVPFAANNVTTIEANYSLKDNPFEMGGIFANLGQVFGHFGPDWLLPIPPWRPISDGVSFPKVGEPLTADGYTLDESAGVEAEQIWKYRYNVRLFPVEPNRAADRMGPLQTLKDWWSMSFLPDHL